MEQIAGRRAHLKKLLMNKEIVIAPGAYDALTAKLIEQAGFPAVYITGAGVATTKLGVPDIGLVTMSELIDTAKNIVNAVDIPVICDIDTGFGNSVNLMRTVREFEQIGVCAVQLEDQISPKRCGHLDGKQVVSREEMVKKIAAFQYARQSEDFLLIARTDAISVYCFNDAIERAKVYVEVGADIVFVEAPRNLEEIERIPKLIKDIPLLINMVNGSDKTPLVSCKQLQEMGYSLAIYPTILLLSAIKEIQSALGNLKSHGDIDDLNKNMISLEKMFQIVGLQHYRDSEKNFMDLIK